MWDSSTLQLFAKHYKTGQPIRPDLLSRANKAKEFGKGSYVRSQIVYAKMSLLYHACGPSGINTDQLARKLTNEYNLFGFVEGTHFQCSFTHLEDYSALVYTYLWSHVTAKDMFSQFDTSSLESWGLSRPSCRAQAHQQPWRWASAESCWHIGHSRG